ncbi:MAG: hypothetical protein COC12_12495 [Rhodobacteraceae bacterium]|nr:MAG: hypothetical protein COC12_12495 [Paracoccaceae bacterium]
MADDQIATTAQAVEADALPKMHEVHADPDSCAGLECAPKDVAGSADGKSPARWAYERLILYIQNFEDQLDATQEVAMGFTGGDAGVLKIEGMGYFDPDIITFYGSDSMGIKTQLVQHVSQLSVMLRALPKTDETAPPTRIGFRLAADLEQG